MSPATANLERVPHGGRFGPSALSSWDRPSSVDNPAATTRTGSRPLGWDGRPPNRRVISLHALTKPHWDRPVLSRTSSAVADEQLGVPELGTRRDPGSAPACRQFRHYELPVPAGRMAALTGTDGA